jgi:hypothetical protein
MADKKAEVKILMDEIIPLITAGLKEGMAFAFIVTHGPDVGVGSNMSIDDMPGFLLINSLELALSRGRRELHTTHVAKA